MADDWIIKAAQQRGDIAYGAFRVVVVEPGGRQTINDFPDQPAAVAYADDAAGEWNDEPILAYVLNHDFEIVARGKPYYS